MIHIIRDDTDPPMRKRFIRKLGDDGIVRDTGELKKLSRSCRSEDLGVSCLKGSGTKTLAPGSSGGLGYRRKKVMIPRAHTTCNQRESSM